MRSWRWTHSVFPLGAALVVFGLVAGCDNSIVPYAETTRHFAIFGFLDADRDTQYMRIEATRPFSDIENGVLEIATVTTTQLSDGQVITWRGSTIDLEDGGRGLLYTAFFRPKPGHAYQVAARRADGATSYATTTVPDLRQVEVEGATRTFAGTYEQAIEIDGVSRRPETIIMNYDVASSVGAPPIKITLDYDVFGVPNSIGGWRISVRLTRDKQRIHSRLSLDPGHLIGLHDVSMTLRLLSNDWPPIGSNENFTNVVDGFGFFGSAATHSIQWRIDSQVVAGLGFDDRQKSDVGGG